MIASFVLHTLSSSRAVLPPPVNLLVEHLSTPAFGIDSHAPRFSFTLPPTLKRGAVQTAYEIIVNGSTASTRNATTAWAVRAESSASTQIQYAGAALQSDSTYTWSVRWQADGGVWSAFAPTASFDIGLLTPSAWEGATWLGCAGPPAPTPSSSYGRFIRPVPTTPCPGEGGYPDGCMFFESAKDKERHFVMNCQDKPKNWPLCDATKAKPCWAATEQALGSVVDVNHSEFLALKRGANFSCAEDPALTPVVPPICNYIRAATTVMQPAATVVRARAHFACMGWCVLYVNGEEATSIGATLEPGWSQWDARLLYATYDVTDAIVGHTSSSSDAPLPLVVGVAFGGGWPGHLGHPQAAKILVSIDFADGKRQTLSTVESHWHASSHGPLIYDDLYNGEHFDARIAATFDGWSTSTFNAKAEEWQHAVDPKDPTLVNAQMSTQPMPPIRKYQLLDPITVTTLGADVGQYSGEVVLDFGQNIAGWAKVELTGCASGTNLTLRFAEVLCGRGPVLWSTRCTPSGAIDQRNLREAKATDVYTCAGSFNPEIWEPKTTYHGFRFVQISGLPASMLAKIGKKGSGVAIQARVVHSDIYYPTADPKRTSTADTPGSLTFKAGPGGSSHAAMLNQLQSNVQWTQRDNLFSVPTDCDQRNERQGWMADASLSSEEAINSFWMAPLYSNWLRMMSDVQSVAATEGDCDIHCPTFPNCTGTVTDTVPHVKGLYGKRPADPSWGFAYPLIYDNVRRYYGDDAPVVVELYDGLKAYVEWELRAADAMEAKNPTTNGLLTFHYYGDWLEPGRVPSQESVSQMSAAFNFIQSLRIQRDAAKALGRAKDYQKYLKLFASKAAAYQKHFFNTSRSTADGGPAYGPAGSEVQPTLVYPLWLGDAIADATLDAAVLAALMDDIVTAKRGHVATGIVASKWLMELLSERGASQLALDLLLQRSFPSWGYMISLNATTVWEHWEYMNGDGMNSHNHPAFAAVGAWMYRYIGGLRLGGSAHPAICGVPEERFAGGAFARSVFGPHVVDDARIAGVATKMTTIRGVMRSSWRAVYDADHTITALEMNWTLPSNVIGELRMPLWRHNNKTVSPSAITVTEGTRVVFKNGTFADAKVPGVVGGCVGHEASGDAVVVLRVAGGGAYRFTATVEAH